MTAGQYRVVPVVAVAVAVLVAVSGCSGLITGRGVPQPSITTATATAEPSFDPTRTLTHATADPSEVYPSSAPGDCSVDGVYTGHGEVTLSFEVAGCGTTISMLQGDTAATCTAASGSFQDIPFGPSAHTTAVSGNAFDDSYTDDTGDAETRFVGTLDGAGGASGSLQIRQPACKADGNWGAALDGHTAPAAPLSAPPVAPDTTACAPTPCGTSAKVTMSITHVLAVPPGNGYPFGGAVVVFTVTNNDGVAHGVLGTDATLTSGTGAHPASRSDPQQANGDSLVRCTAVVNLQPAQSAQDQKFCFPYTSAQEAGQDLSLGWHVGNEPQSSVIAAGPAR